MAIMELVTKKKLEDKQLRPTRFAPSGGDKKEFVLFDEKNELSLVNLIPEPLIASFEAVRSDHKMFHITELGEKRLRERVEPDPRLARLRIAFWDEFGRALDKGSRMQIKPMIGGIIPYETYLKLTSDPVNMAYILNPPTNYRVAVEEALVLAVDRVREFLELPLVDSAGRPIPAVINGIMKALDFLDKRVNGSILQKVAVHQHHTTGDNVLGFEDADEGLMAIEEKIASIRETLGEKLAANPGLEVRKPIGGSAGGLPDYSHKGFMVVPAMAPTEVVTDAEEA